MEKKYIALTFDDGPNDTTTGEVLVKLLQHHVVATFFLVGELITEETKEMVRNAHDMGCEIANHSFSHSDLAKLPKEVMLKEINDTNDKIFETIGEVPKFFRPPYLSVSEEMRKSVPLTMIAGYGCEDWKEEVSARERAERIENQIKEGGIILMHDMAGNRKTVLALNELIPALIDKGYTFVTVSELFEKHDVKDTASNGVIYTDVCGNAW